MIAEVKLHLDYDQEHDVWTLRHEAVFIRDADDISQWRALLTEEFAKLEGKRVYLLIDTDGFSLNPAVAEQYGGVAKMVVSTYAIGVVRYGADSDLTQTAIRIGAIKNRFPANIFPSREVALEVLAKVRQLA